ncbi:sugar transferase [Sphaerisporangium rufum]|uniref:sugar transferase n=1 Tax=Sphaerisporangium rufum TaxID=1381558 RepID=UPI0023B3566D|nr:sugar transferase [Sphaerisporangium rufum]
MVSGPAVGWAVPGGPSRAGRLGKAAFERAVAAAALLLLAPVLVALAIGVRLTGPGPVLVRRAKVGRGGARFTAVALRTIRLDAPGGQGGCHPVRRGGGRGAGGHGAFVRLRRDSRLTRYGAWLRRHSLDELPQLLNVLLGQMSLVGPRPRGPGEIPAGAAGAAGALRRLPMRPGMTGLWQVDGGPDLSFEESVRLDLRYVEHWSLALDLHILWRTWSVVARGPGARQPGNARSSEEQHQEGHRDDTRRPRARPRSRRRGG